MLLTRVEIKNFRSIADLKFTFDPKCLVLVGINESGKSNIIKALATLSEDILVFPNDVRQSLPDEEIINESYIRFIFTWTDEDVSEIKSEIFSTILCDDYNQAIVTKSDKSKITFDDFFATEKKNKLYVVNILKNIKNSTSYRVINKYDMLPNFVKPSVLCPDTFQIILKDGTTVPLKKYSIIDKIYTDKIPVEYLVNITFDEFNKMVDKVTDSYFKDCKPDALYWNYSDKNLLPAQIDISQFTADPNICNPLKQMFVLAGIKDIKKKIDEETAISTQRLRNCLNRVAENTTKHFREVWKEYNDVSLHLNLNGNFIEASVKDNFNHYEFTNRSDGFKRFITFLLMISAKVKTNYLTDTLILVDEPDICLHPSGARYLRDELINISNKNYVIYSTHSIFMIDKDNIGRHLIVKKNNEKTTVENVTTTNILDEEVLYNALGYSIFESLKKDNIIFEGWKDKKLCDEALKKLPKEYKHLKSKFNLIGLCHSKGTKAIQNVTPLLQLANRKCFILSDNDKPAIDAQKEFNKSKGYGIWLRYCQVDTAFDAITGEDFVDSTYIVECMKKISTKYPSLTDFTCAELGANGKLSSIQRWLKTKSIPDEEIKKQIDAIKEYIFEHLKAANIEPSYYLMLEKIADRFEAL